MDRYVRPAKTLGLFLLALAMLGSTGWGATAEGSAHWLRGGAKGKTVKTLNANAWLIKTTNWGSFCYPESPGYGGYWGGPGYNYIYGAGLWVGTVDSSSVPRVSVGYNPNDGSSEFGPVNPYTGDWVNQATDPLARMYLSTNPTDLTQWPLRDSLGQPIVRSQQDGYASYSDQNPAFTRTGDTMIGVRVDQISHAWNIGTLADVVFFRFTVKNMTADTLRNLYLSPAFDADIGDESGTGANDRTAFDVGRNLAIQYQTEPETGWPRVGYFGCRFFESPCNNTGDTVHVVDNQYPRSIPPDSILGMTAFKVITIDVDPRTDGERYQMMQGITFTTGDTDAYDETGELTQGDKRFVMSTGPFNLAPGDSAATCAAVMAAYDTATLKAASDYAQVIYDNGFRTLPVTITSPNGGEVISGTTTIAWTADAPAAYIKLSYSADEGSTWTEIADSLTNTGTYSWNTTALADGVRYLVSAFVYGDSVIGGDQSDGCFTVNNGGANIPEIRLIQPLGGETWAGDQYIKFMNGLSAYSTVKLEFKMQGSDALWDSLITIERTSQHWVRDSILWDTRTVPNYPYYVLRLKASEKFVPADSAVQLSDSFAIDNPYPDIDSLRHTSGSCNVAYINPYVVDTSLLTGHRYEFRFRNITRGAQVGVTYQPRYSYDLWDVDLNTQKLSDQGITVPMDSLPRWDIPTPVDGIEPEVRYCIDGNDLYVDSARITTDAGIPSVDTVRGAAYITSYRWMSRSATYEIRWHVQGTYPNDTLTADVWDMDNNVPVPLDTLPLNNLTRSAWSFGPQPAGAGRSYVASGWPTAGRSYLFICGALCYFNRGTSTSRLMTWSTHPVEGEVWKLFTSGPKPPREGDVYSFLGVNGVGGAPLAPASAFSLFQNAPNPFDHGTTLQYQLAGPAAVKLNIYNIAGQLVRNLVDTRQGAGMHAVRWDGRNGAGQKLSAGIYLYRLQDGDKTLTRKLVLVR